MALKFYMNDVWFDGFCMLFGGRMSIHQEDGGNVVFESMGIPFEVEIVPSAFAKSKEVIFATIDPQKTRSILLEKGYFNVTAIANVKSWWKRLLRLNVRKFKMRVGVEGGNW